jgi:small subunit ribosomal protein S10e
LLVYAHLFKEGCLVAKKDHHKEKHSDALNIPNLEVIGLLRSFRSKGYVKETFNWQYYYWYLTNEGIEYLRSYLALPSDAIPATLKAPAVASKPTALPSEQEDRRKGKGGPGGDFKPSFERGGGGGRDGGRDGYRSREQRA